ncbi:putative nuclease HARBI1 [Drosophila subobscura]|uniref:putative nuclease HARBI1 n=1 Tax=Drosophila subobscura TaxID=7241 RepID=UPI00155AB59B|nr:putative nuclease HARBI1 [Drosophila subobscura]
MKDIESFERSLKDFQYVESVRRFQFSAEIIKGMGNSSRKKQHKRFNPLCHLNEHQFRRKYRYTKENIRRIIEIVRDDLEIDCYEPTEREQVPIDLQILSAIRFWGGTEHPKLTAMVHGVSLKTLKKITRRIASVLSSKASRYIRMPATLSEKERMMRSFQELANMPQVIGTLLQTRVRFQSKDSRVHATDDVRRSQANTKKIVHMQLVCDADYKIRDLDIRLLDEGSPITDTEMFCLSKIKERFEQNEFRGRILLGNESFSCSSYLFTPEKLPKSLPEELYNHAHSVTYASARKCLNILMLRFGILGSEVIGSFASVKQTITALAILHNMAMDWSDPSIDTETSVSPFNSFNALNGIPTPGEHSSRTKFIKTHF